jgi:UDP-2,3-diacylglucosamine pyrophosphatase LpxH
VEHNLIILSDIHLGSDLVQHLRPGSPTRGTASERRDHDLAGLFDWYRAHRHDERPWRLVIAGDLVDFVGMSVSPGDRELRLSKEEAIHGLGGSAAHTLAKLRYVAKHHDEVFRSLALFVAAGNSLVMVRGNHDVDFHWAPVQEEFIRILRTHAAIEPEQITFCPWFYYEEGRIYIEHGHQYDPYCSYDSLLNPVCPRDPQRSWRSLSDILLRFVVRPTQGLTEVGHETARLLDYLRFAMRLGIRGMVGLGARFARAVAAATGTWWEHSSRAAAVIKHEHERRLSDLAARSRMSLAKLRELAALQAPPITRNLAKLLSSVMVDRVVVALAIPLGALLAGALMRDWSEKILLAVALGAAVSLLGLLWYKMRSAIDTTAELRASALRIAQVLPAAFVVMGHSHVPERVMSSGSTYVNLGAWAEQDHDGVFAQGSPPSRTHLVIHESEGMATAKLLVWNPDQGPCDYLEVESATR